MSDAPVDAQARYVNALLLDRHKQETDRSSFGSSSTSPLPPLSSRAKDAIYHREKKYGNYSNYYNFRPASTSTSNQPDPTSSLDQRLQLLSPSLFKGKRVLDLGTNAGKISHDLRIDFEPEEVLGIDIDEVLVEDAKRIAKEQGLERGLRFMMGDFMQEGWLEELSEKEGPRQFDVVLLFSVTKWLHLHHGDNGMLRLFDSLYKILPLGGVVIIEPQERENYARAVKKNKDLRRTYKTIEIWPPFEREMSGAGFKLDQRIERVEGGFSRPLLIWRKEKEV
ncbi:class I SAM-dependent methyltransferase [Sporobolomyces salmoneus]|uniref:class I SAM-dependent methyltransferase n=1 Tax=Sporobolomyces salmoneus TaxID=183962 RepID=UPI0031701AFE